MPRSSDDAADAPHEEPVDEALVARMASGDEGALRVMIARYEARLHVFALRQTGAAQDAEEIVASAFHALWRKSGQWADKGTDVAAGGGPARPATWLHRVVANAAIDLSRRRRLRRWLGMGTGRAAPEDGTDPRDLIADAAPGPEERAVARAELARVRRDLAALPERQRAAVLLAGGGHGVPEIAAILDVSRGAAEQMLVRGRRALRAARAAREELG